VALTSALADSPPLADEGLLVPFYVNSKAVGTIWAIAHSNRRKFDTEDLRLLESMGHFASVAYQAVESIEDLKSEIVARKKADGELRQLTADLEKQRAISGCQVGANPAEQDSDSRRIVSRHCP
jgi:hypothetical protein